MKLRIALFGLPTLVVIYIGLALSSARMAVLLTEFGPRRAYYLNKLDAFDYADARCRQWDSEADYRDCMERVKSKYLASLK